MNAVSYYYPQFPEKETEVKRGLHLAKGPLVIFVGLGLKPGLLQMQMTPLIRNSRKSKSFVVTESRIAMPEARGCGGVELMTEDQRS